MTKPLSETISEAGDYPHDLKVFRVKDVALAVEDLKSDIFDGVDMVVKMYPHKSGIELASEISSYLNQKVLLRRFGEFGGEKK